MNGNKTSKMTLKNTQSSFNVEKSKVREVLKTKENKKTRKTKETKVQEQIEVDLSRLTR